MHDPSIYPSPTDFKPERYFEHPVSVEGAEINPDPRNLAFGFGRR